MIARAIALALTTFGLFATAAVAGADRARSDSNGGTLMVGNASVPSGDRTLVSRGATRLKLSGSRTIDLAPLQVADIDADGDGRVSFDELLRADAPSLAIHRGF